MKKLIAVFLFCLGLVALTLSDGRTLLAIAYPHAETEITVKGVPTSGGTELLRSDCDAVTVRLPKRSADRVLTLLSARVVNDYTVHGMRVIEAYSPLLTRCVLLPEGRVNLQIAVRSQDTVVGLPMIVGGY